jgi:hypothetical protein
MDKFLIILLIAILFPSIGFALSVMAGGKQRNSCRPLPPSHAPGWRNKNK